MDLSDAVEKTLAYGGYFHYPLSPSEVHFWLITPHSTSKESIKKYISPLKPGEISLKKVLLENTKQKEKIVLEFVKHARFIPGIRLIGLTGSVAINNTKGNDDLDLLIITAPHTLWLVRPLLLLLLSFGYTRRHPGDNPHKTNNAFCPNLWLDLNDLCVPQARQNIYTAHEVLQVKPILDREDTHKLFIKSNSWVGRYLANAYKELSKGKVKKQNPSILSLIFAPLNLLSFFLQYLYMLPKITTEKVSLHAAYFHKNDLSGTLQAHIKSKTSR